MGFFEFEAGGFRVHGVMCSFCGQRVEPGEVDPVELTITARADRSSEDGTGQQMTWCHAACLEASGLRDLHVTRLEFWEDPND